MRAERLLRKMGAAGAAGAATVMAFSVGTLPAAFADTAPLNPEQESVIRATMHEEGVSAEVQDALIQKIQLGELLDSQKGDAVAVETYSSEEEGVRKNVERFADGSMRWTEQEIPTSGNGGPSKGLNPSKSECKKSGSWNVNCKVGISDFVSNASFRIDYRTNQVRDYRAASCANAAGSCSVSGGIKRAQTDSVGPASAELQFSASVGPILNVAHGAFGIRVSGNTATVYG